MEEWNARADPEDQRSDDFLVGRQEQLQSLFQLFPGPGSGRRRQSFVLLGEAGVGKSHLLAHFLAHGAVSDAQIVTTSCFKSKQEEYLYPWQAVMLSIASYIRKEDIPIPTAYRQAVSALFPVFGSGEGSVEKKAHMLIDSVMSFDSVLMILSLAAEKRPLLLVLEDIQWMDKISADLLDQLLHKADSSRILFAATCRQPSGPVATPLLRGLDSPYDRPLHFTQLRQLEHERIVMLPSDWRLAKLLYNTFSVLNVEPQNILVTTNNTTAINLAAGNMGFAFLQESGISRTPYLDRLACFTIGEPPLTCPTAVVYKKNGFLSPAARAFIDLTKDFYRRFNRDGNL